MKRFLLFTMFLFCVTLNAQLYPVPIYSVTSKQTPQGGEEPSYTIDGNTDTMYHSQWYKNGIPDELNFTLYANAQSIKQIVYTPRQSGGLNGVWTNVDIYYSKKSQPDNFINIAKGLVWADDSTDKTINLATAIQDVAVVRFDVNAGHGNFSSCAEMKFYSEEVYSPNNGVDCTIPTASLSADTKVSVLSATASNTRSGCTTCGIEKTFDGDLTTVYKSNTSGAFPLDLIYNFDGSTPIAYFRYTPRTDGSNGGLFQNVNISYNTTANSMYQNLMSFNFNGSYSPTTVQFPNRITPLSIKITVTSGVVGYATCAEMEFYTGVDQNLQYTNIFVDGLYSALKTGVTQTQIDAMSSDFYKSIAQCLFNGTYNSAYRVQKYQVYKPVGQVSQELKVGGSDVFENPTGIFFKSGNRVALFVRNLPTDKVVPLNLLVQGFDDPWTGDYYPLKNGMNVFDITHDGLGYISYFNSDLTLPDVEINIVNGTVNGYYDYKKSSLEDWPVLLQKTVYPRIDVIGEYAHLVYNRNVLKSGCPYDIVGLISKYDEIIRNERLIMGLFKYNKSPKNHQMAFSDYNETGWYAYGNGINLDPSWGEHSVTDPQQLSFWGIAHEFGHNNQIRPDIKWIGTTEVTNNIYSAWCQYNMEFDGKYTRLETNDAIPSSDMPSVVGGDINGTIDFTQIQNQHISSNSNVFRILVPFWQLELYYQLAGACHNAPQLSMDYPGSYTGVDYARWFGTVAEVARNTNSNGLTNGELMLNFVKNTCDAVQEDLTDFFKNTGFLKPINKDIDDYGVGHMEVTQAQIDQTIAYIKGKNYQKPVSPVMNYISANSMQTYKNKLALSGVTGLGFTLNGTTMVIDNTKWTGAVAFETYDTANVLMHVAIVGTGDISLKNTTVFYPSNASAVYAIGYDGSKILVYPVPQSPSNLSYTSPNVFTKNLGISSLSPTVSGGAVSSYNIAPNLPAGLSFDIATGKISGTPTEVSTMKTYTVTATNSGGSTTFGVVITVNDIAPSNLSYPSPNVFTKNSVISNLNPTVSGGTVSNYSITPSLPAGLSFNTATGIISGTPTEVSAMKTYTVTATNSGGNTSFGVVITVNDIAPSNLSYPSPNVFTKNSVITNLNPTVSGGTVSNYSITPSLPTGLSFNTATGIISGTPTEVSTMKTYAVTATNSGGSTTFGVVITVNDIAPSNLSYASPNVFAKNSVISNLNPTVSGGAVSSYSITPSLPVGLSFNTATGIISGTPSEVSAMKTYTVTATNSGGSTSFGVVITVNDNAPSNLSYPSPNVFTKKMAVSNLNPTVSGGTVSSYSITPSLPPGLSFDTATGVISGTPTKVSAMKTYTVTATNSFGSTTFGVVITVNDSPPKNLSYTSPNMFSKNSVISDLSPTASGGTVDSYSITPSLPTGLSLDTATGIISGTPAEVWVMNTYTVTAMNTGGSTSFEVVIAVNDNLGRDDFENDKILVYPNPIRNDETFNIVFDENQGIFYGELNSVEGKQIQKFNGNIAEIERSINSEIGKLESGVYILSLQNQEGRSYGVKLIKK